MQIYNALTIPLDLTDRHNDAEFCFQLERKRILFDQIRKVSGVCESDSFKISTAFANLLYFQMVLREVRWMSVHRSQNGLQSHITTLDDTYNSYNDHVNVFEGVFFSLGRLALTMH